MVWELKKNKGPQNIGKNVAGNGTKIHLIIGKNDPISLRLTGANVHDSVPVKEMIESLKGSEIKGFVADKAYDDAKIRDALKDAKIMPNIPHRKNKGESFFFDQTLYTWRWRVEAFFGKLKENRRIAMRVDKLDTSYLAFICLAFIKMIVC